MLASEATDTKTTAEAKAKLPVLLLLMGFFEHNRNEQRPWLFFQETDFVIFDQMC